MADDDADFRLLLVEAVRHAGFGGTIHQVADGTDAVAFLCACAGGAASCDMACLDIEMPGAGGIDILRWLQDSPDLASLPVAIVTGVGDDRISAEARRLGAKLFARKSNRPTLLAYRLLSLIPGWRALGEDEPAVGERIA